MFTAIPLTRFISIDMPEAYVKRPTWAEINLNNLAFNINSIKAFIGKKISYMAVVKADGYGHGAINCAKRLEEEGIDWLGVALPEEGLELRRNNIKAPILCLGGFWAGQENILLENNLTPVIYNLDIAERFNNAAGDNNIKANIHVKIDTGMGRIGVRFDDVEIFAEKLKKLTHLNIEGIMTHFASAENPQENDFTNLQIERFYEAVKIFEAKGFSPVYKDLANSPGALVHPSSLGNMVRLGGILYGIGNDILPPGFNLPKLIPVMSLYSKITHLKKVSKGETLGYGRTFLTNRDSIIATIPIGYQDGYKRSLSNSAKVIVNNCFAPVVGRISMDWTIIDVTDVPDVRINDEVIIIGDSGSLNIKAEDLAAKTGTISYEITCGIHRRVTKKYVGS